MSKIKFAKPAKPRFDMSQAVNGVWFYIQDEAGNDYGGYKCALFDPSVPRVQVLIDRENRQASAKARGKREDDMAIFRSNMRFFIEAVLLDWDITDEAGKAIPFSMENALDFFMSHEIDEETGKKVFDYDYVYRALNQMCREVTNYQSDDQVAAGDPLGN